MKELLSILLSRIATDIGYKDSEVTVYFGKGYRIRIDMDFEESFTGCRMFTSGLNYFDHAELEIVFPMPVRNAVCILKTLANSVVTNNKVYKSGQILKKDDLAIYEIVETPHNTLRIIIADSSNRIGMTSMNRMYATQYVYNRYLNHGENNAF